MPNLRVPPHKGLVLHATHQLNLRDIATTEGLLPTSLGVIPGDGVCFWPTNEVDEEWVYNRFARSGPVRWLAVPHDAYAWQSWEDWMLWTPECVPPSALLLRVGRRWEPVSALIQTIKNI